MRHGNLARRLGVLLLGWASFSWGGAPGAGDRNLPLVLKYPSGAFQAGGGRILDVTKPPFNARGDGITDDTRALIAAYNHVADRLRSGRDGWNYGTGCILYLPKGTYLVSNTVIYDGPRIAYGDGDPSVRGISKVRFVGEDRRNTIIRLKDNATGFGPGAAKPVLAFQKGYEDGSGNNIPALNLLRNLTVHTGSGNPGAVGVVFLGANVSGIGGLTVVSGDRLGRIGLSFPTYSVQGHYKDITIDGFEVGIQVTPLAEDNPVLEYVTLRNQRTAAVLVERGSPCLRRVLSRNRVPALRMSRPGSQVVLLDSELRGGAPDAPAIEILESGVQLFARSVAVEGYGQTIRRKNVPELTGSITEWMSSRVFSLWAPREPRSMNLTVVESPILDIPEDTSLWANPEAYTGDDAERLQKAMNSGKPAVFLPKEEYNLSRPVLIPASVRYVDAMFGRIEGILRVSEASSSLLGIEHANAGAVLEQGAARPVALSHTRGIAYRNRQAQEVRVHLEGAVDVGSGEDFCNRGVAIHGRSINNEDKGRANFLVNGGRLWTLGFKTEGHQPSFLARNGGVLEVLGGYRNETTSDAGLPMVLNDNANVSFIGYTNMASVYQQGVWEIRNGESRKMGREEFPHRDGYDRDFYIPLYVGYAQPEYPLPLPLVSARKGSPLRSALSGIPDFRGRDAKGRKTSRAEPR